MESSSAIAAEPKRGREIHASDDDGDDDDDGSRRKTQRRRTQIKVTAFFIESTPRAGFTLLQTDLHPQVAFEKVLNPSMEQLEAHGVEQYPNSRFGCYVVRREDEGDGEPFVVIGSLGDLRQKLYGAIRLPGYGRHT